MSLFFHLPRWDTVIEQNPDHTVCENEDNIITVMNFEFPVIPY